MSESSSFVSNLLFFLVYFGVIAYLHKSMKTKTSIDNVITKSENNFMYYIFIFFVVYLFLSLFTSISSWKHRFFVIVIASIIIGIAVNSEKLASSGKKIFDVKFFIPYFVLIPILLLLAYVPQLKSLTLDMISTNIESFNKTYSIIGPLFKTYFIITIIYYLVFIQYNQNTPSSNAIQPLILAPILLFTLLYFVTKFVIELGIVKKYNFTNVMVSVYLIFSIFFCFYLYNFITTVQQLAKQSPETAAAKAELQAQFDAEKGITKYIRKYVLWVIIISLVLLYWIRDNVYWNRISVILYFFVTIMLFYTAKLVKDTPDGTAATLSTVFFLEWFLATKLRWHSVANSMNILFSGIEHYNKDQKTTPTLLVSEQ
jgi:hypothetical protein